MTANAGRIVGTAKVSLQSLKGVGVSSMEVLAGEAHGWDREIAPSPPTHAPRLWCGARMQPSER